MLTLIVNAHSHQYSRARQSAELSSSPSKSHHHRRTQSSPFRYPSRTSPFAPAHDSRPHYLHHSSASQAYTPYRESSARFSPYPASLPPVPPRTASSVASSSFLDHVTDDEDDLPRRIHANGEPDEDAEQPFAFSPARRRISFSTSAERDAPLAPPMPAVPPTKLTSLWANRKPRGSEGLEDERVGRHRERKPQEMLPTPPMSSPELEVAQPLPPSSRRSEAQQSARLPSQPMRREPSIPVGSLSSPSDRSVTPLRERKRKERPTLMDLLSSPQPSVSPERPPTSSSYLASSSDLGATEEQAVKRTVLSPLREDIHAEKPVEQPSASPSKTVRDDSLPPSSPFSTPWSSPVKSSLPSSSPRRSVSPASEQRPPVAKEAEADEVWGSSPLSSPLSSPVRASSVTVRISRSLSVQVEDKSDTVAMETTARLRPLELPQEALREDDVRTSAQQQLPTPMTPEFASNPLVQEDKAEKEEMEVDEVSPSSRPLVEPQQYRTPTPVTSRQSHSPSMVHIDMPIASSSTPRPLLFTPTITTVQITVDMKTEEEEVDVEMQDASDIIAPSSPLSEISSPSLMDRVEVSISRASPSDTEDERMSSPMEKRKVPPSPRKGLMRKKMRVDSVSSVDVSPSERDTRSASGSEDSESEAEHVVRKPASRGRGTGRGRGRGRGRGARTVASKRKATPMSEASDGEDEKSQLPQLPTPSATPDQDEDVQATKPKRQSKKQGKRRASSPPRSAAVSRSPSPTPSHRERSKAPTRRRSKSNKLKATQHVDWEAVSPLSVPELEGMIIETLATARATSLSANVLYDALLRARPALKSMNRKVPEEREEEASEMGNQEPDASPLNKREWLQLLTYVCTAGHFSSGVFGRVDSSASDSDGPSSKKRSPWADAASMASGSVSKAQLYEIARTKYAQRAQWYYVPEQDVDKDRASVVKSMMRGPGKRSETMKYKRYYWKPLSKISRWDREDDL